MALENRPISFDDFPVEKSSIDRIVPSCLIFHQTLEVRSKLRDTTAILLQSLGFAWCCGLILLKRDPMAHNMANLLRMLCWQGWLPRDHSSGSAILSLAPKSAGAGYPRWSQGVVGRSCKRGVKRSLHGTLPYWFTIIFALKIALFGAFPIS